jgi:hypothetical protein
MICDELDLDFEACSKAHQTALEWADEIVSI